VVVVSARQNWDICRNAPTPEMTEWMKKLTFPQSDPVAGSPAGIDQAVDGLTVACPFASQRGKS